jgi:predicted Rossmann fold flavoprotein
VHKQKVSVLIIGAGASGIVAAISAARSGAQVSIVERMPQMGKKILICGAGRCNLLNERLDESYYNKAGRQLVRSILGKFGKKAIRDFFSELGLVSYSEEGRIFPVTNQASSVWHVLALELKKLKIEPQYDFDVLAIEKGSGGFTVRARGARSIQCSKLILAAGGKSYPCLGANGSGFTLAAGLGHSIVEPVPAAVPLVVKDAFCHTLQGQRIRVNVKSVINGSITQEETGDLFFTKFGLSGTAVLDVSREISIAKHRPAGPSKVDLVVDMVPFMDRDTLRSELISRFKKFDDAQDALAGILPDKFCRAYNTLLSKDSIEDAVSQLKEKRFTVAGTRGWNEAEFTAGGVSTDEIDSATLESKKVPQMYLCGEVVDVDGTRGGYNLAWAWASGFVAGLTQ